MLVRLMDVAKFVMKDEGFKCVVCGEDVPKLSYTARDHCPKCLCSIHVDNNPGDRLCMCHGILKPIEIMKWKKEQFKIVYKCSKCGMIKKNVNAKDDNMDKIIEIRAHQND